jgi:RND family efflux transporter MFP subunit
MPISRASVLALGLVLALIAVGCEQPVVEPVDVVRPVKMLTLGAGGEGATLEYPGSVNALLTANVAFEVPGLVIELPVQEGEPVVEGQLLAHLDPRDFEAQRDAVIATRNVTWADYQRYQDLYAADAASLQELEVARRAYEVSEANLRIAEKAVEDTYLRAPFTGIVARRIVDDFENVQAKEAIVTLQDDSVLEVKVDIPETDALLAPRGSIGERSERADFTVELSSLPNRPFPARLTEFATTADPVTRTFEVTFQFEPPSDVFLRPGMTAKVVAQLRPSEAGAFLVPAVAVVGGEGGGVFVWVIDTSSMTATKRTVRVGDMSGDQIQILSGLQSGETIAISGTRSLREDMQVSRLES